MNSQQLEYVRQQLIVATADLSGATKGQLVAFAENAQFTATARSRGRKKITDPVTGRKVNPEGTPMSGSQSRAKGSSIALVSPVEFGTASWRRAVLSLDEHQKAWLLWNYSENIRFEYRGDNSVGVGRVQGATRREEGGRQDDGTPEETYLAGGAGRQSGVGGA